MRHSAKSPGRGGGFSAAVAFSGVFLGFSVNYFFGGFVCLGVGRRGFGFQRGFFGGVKIRFWGFSGVFSARAGSARGRGFEVLY